MLPYSLKPSTLLSATTSFCLGFALAITPVIFIHKGFNHLHAHWQESVFYWLIAALCGISTLLGFSLKTGVKETPRQRYLVWTSIIFMFWYIAASSLCEKLSLSTLASELWRTAGLVILISGSLLRLWAIAVLGYLHSGYVTIQDSHQVIKRGPYRWLRHPSYLGIVIMLLGIPLIFKVWFPLLAIPGVLVGLKWRMNDEEQLLKEHFGNEYEEYQRHSWRIIPFVY